MRSLLPKPIFFTQHAQNAIAARNFNLAWVEAAVREPDWIEPDPDDSEVERRFRVTPEAGGRILRVPVVETTHHIRVVTVTYDRNARLRRR